MNIVIGIDSLHRQHDSCQGTRAAAGFQKAFVATTLGFAVFLSPQCIAHVTDETVGKIAEVAVSGGADTVNPGTTCIKLEVPSAPPLAAACPGGYVAIPNNNSKLVSAAMMAKSTASLVSVYYVSDGATQHCPNRVFTPCAAISIFVR